LASASAESTASAAAAAPILRLESPACHAAVAAEVSASAQSSAGPMAIDASHSLENLAVSISERSSPEAQSSTGPMANAASAAEGPGLDVSASAQSLAGPMAIDASHSLGSPAEVAPHVSMSERSSPELMAADNKRPPVTFIFKHRMFSHGLNGIPFTKPFDSLQELAVASLNTVFPGHTNLKPWARIGVVERMIECVSQSRIDVLNMDVLHSLVHRKEMHADITDWFLVSFCQACGFSCACETKKDLVPAHGECTFCPFTMSHQPNGHNLIVWGISLLEKIRMCKDMDEIQELLRSKFMRKNPSRAFLVFLYCWNKHFTTGAIHIPSASEDPKNLPPCASSPNHAKPALSWWCSMQWPMDKTTKDTCAAFVEAVTDQQPTFHEVTVPLQRTNECAARSLDQLVLNVLQIARGLCPRSLVQPARNVINDNGDALRLLVGLNYLWSVASGGYFDYDETFRIATSGNPARAVDLISSDSDKESDEQDLTADSSTGGGASRLSRGIIMETLLYTPNTAECLKK